MKDTHSISTSIDGYHALISSDSSEPRTDQREYQKKIGSLMYAMIATRPDIAYAVEKLSQYCQDSSQRHRIVLNRIFRYLKRTADLMLLYDNSADSICYANASYENDASDRKSTYENTLLIENEAVIGVNKKQRTIASSITEVEYVFMCQVSKNIVGATRWIKELQLTEVLKNSPIQLLGDNQGSFDLIKNSEHHSRTKHIDVQYHYVREVAADGLIKPSYVPISNMIADILIKSTKSPVFLHLRGKLSLIKVSFWASIPCHRLHGNQANEHAPREISFVSDSINLMSENVEKHEVFSGPYQADLNSTGFLINKQPFCVISNNFMANTRVGLRPLNDLGASRSIQKVARVSWQNAFSI